MTWTIKTRFRLFDGCYWRIGLPWNDVTINFVRLLKISAMFWRLYLRTYRSYLISMFLLLQDRIFLSLFWTFVIMMFLFYLMFRYPPSPSMRSTRSTKSNVSSINNNNNNHLNNNNNNKNSKNRNLSRAQTPAPDSDSDDDDLLTTNKRRSQSAGTFRCDPSLKSHQIFEKSSRSMTGDEN